MRPGWAHRARTTAALLLAATGAGCVPASEPAPPAGALGYVTEPSAATRGEPFLTSDGWTVQVERLALNVRVSAAPPRDSSSDFYGSSSSYRFDARKPAVLFARAIPAGLATVSVTFDSSYIGDPFSSFEDETEDLGLTAEARERFLREAEAMSPTPQGFAPYYGPSMLLALRAERAGRVLTMDLTLTVASSVSGAEQRTPLEVRGDTLTSVPLRVAVEHLFEEEGSSRQLRFDDFAGADANEDGVIDGNELGRAAALCAACTSGSFQPASLLLALTARGSHILYVP